MARRPGLYRAFHDKAEAVSEEPNFAFWALASFSVLGSFLVRQLGTHLATWEHIAIAPWTSVPMWLAIGMLGTLTLTILTAFLTPSKVRRSLVIALIAWRLIRFQFGSIACLFVFWTLSSMALVFYYDGWRMIWDIYRHHTAFVHIPLMLIAFMFRVN